MFAGRCGSVITHGAVGTYFSKVLTALFKMSDRTLLRVDRTLLGGPHSLPKLLFTKMRLQFTELNQLLYGGILS